MNKKTSRLHVPGGSDVGLFITLVIISYVVTLFLPKNFLTPLRVALLIVAGILYSGIGLLVPPIVERSGAPLANAAFFGVELVLGGWIVYLSEGSAIFLLLPIAAHAVKTLPFGWAIVGCVLTLLAVIVPIVLYVADLLGPHVTLFSLLSTASFLRDLLPLALQMMVAFAFVALYSRIAVGERDARAEAGRLAAELQQTNRQLREYAARVEELATVRERNRLAREIHDGLGHYLTGINMQIQAGRAVVDLDREAALDALGQAQALAQEGLSEVRRSVSVLRASPLDNLSLPAAIEGLVNECRAAGIATAYQVLGERSDLSPQVDLALYRIAQEGMTNMRKYAQASSAEVTLDYRDEDQVHLTVSDSGIGTDDPSGGYGLIGMRERVQLLGGQVQIETAPGEGFTLRVQVPVEPGQSGGHTKGGSTKFQVENGLE